MSNTISYLQGGKLGDFIHSLCICKYNYVTKGAKADLYIGNVGDVWEKGLDFTYNELKEILQEQKWLNKFEIYNNQKIDVNISMFRRSRLLCSTNWLEFYFMVFLNKNNPPKEYKWIDLKKDKSLKDIVLINRSNRPMSEQLTRFYEKLLSEHENYAFICFDEEQYKNFKIKCPMIKVENLYEFFVKINSCKLYIGNQSAPSAFATSMNVPRIVELFQTPDKFGYMKDMMYYKNFKFFLGDLMR